MIICQLEISDLTYYLEHPGDYLVYNLNHQAPEIMKQAEEAGMVFYKGNSTRKAGKWIQNWTFGASSPKTLKIALYNGVTLYDYSQFDNTTEPLTVEEMERVAAILDTYRDGKGRLPMTGCGIIDKLVPENIRSINTKVMKGNFAIDYSNYYSTAMRGGANAVLNYELVPYETHIDYHQLYASILKSKRFPQGIPRYHDGFVESEFALYVLNGGIAKLKPTGFPLLKSLKGSYMAGIDGEWFKLYDELFVISSIDLQILKENFEIEDLDISATISYSSSIAFEGKDYFSTVVDTIYKGRQENTGSVKRMFKLLNELMAGYFERSIVPVGWWRGLEPAKFNPKLKSQATYKNPIIGIFITSYARQKLNELLHLFPHNRVIAYDTDCVFFAGTKEEVEKMPQIMAIMGENPGQVHYDGIYKDVTHIASKCYYGWDLEKEKPFKKASGLSKSGYLTYWDKKDRKFYKKKLDLKEQEDMEAKKREKFR